MATLTRLLGRPVRRSMFSLVIEVPDRIEGLAKRHHNRFAKEALHEAITRHHRENIPKHFRQDAFQVYGYKERSEKYRKMKERRYKSRRALVKTGASEQRIKREKKITIGGAAEGGKKPIEGMLTVSFDFTKTDAFKASWKKTRFLRKIGRRREMPKAGVTIADMHSEVRRMTDDERKRFAEWFFDGYTKRLAAFQGSRQRNRKAVG